MIQPTAFDAVAVEYDAAFTRRRLGQWLRAAVWERLGTAFPAGSTVLEVGCGTGEDAVWMARRGVKIIATDVSGGMLAVAQAKASQQGLGHQIQFLGLDAAEVWHHPHLPRNFDGAYSNFGALNCVGHLDVFAEGLANRVRPGGYFVAIVMGPWCPWEVAWYCLHGEFNVARRRWRSGAAAHVGDGLSVRVWYPSPRRLRAAFAPSWRHIDTVGIGALLPPTQLSHLVERWPRLFATMAQLERRVRHRWPWTWLNDHYLCVFERRYDVKDAP